jgi:hypothetical protein
MALCFSAVEHEIDEWFSDIALNDGGAALSRLTVWLPFVMLLQVVIFCVVGTKFPNFLD